MKKPSNSIFKRISLLWLCIVIVSCAIFAWFVFYYIDYRARQNNASPSITLDSTITELSVASGDEALYAGVTAYDPEDGDVTSTILIENISPLLDDKTRLVTFAAFDSANHVAKAQKYIVYTDYTSPEIKPTADLVFNRGNPAELLSKLSAYDVIDGDISEKIKLTKSNVVQGLTGKYDIEVSVTNSCGDTVTKPFVVKIEN